MLHSVILPSPFSKVPVREDVTTPERRTQGFTDYRMSAMDEAEKQRIDDYPEWSKLLCTGMFSNDQFGRDYVSHEGMTYLHARFEQAGVERSYREPLADPIDPKTGLPFVGTAAHAGL